MIKESAIPVLTNKQRLARLDKMIAEKRILRHEWVRGKGARERACLLAALSPEVAYGNIVFGEVERCPASVMPMWFAQITPELDDRVSEQWWPCFLRAYAMTLRRVHRLIDKKLWTADDWRRQHHLALAFALAMPFCFGSGEGAADVVKQVIAYHQRVATRRGIKASLLEEERCALLGLLRKHRGRRRIGELVHLGNRNLEAARMSVEVFKTSHSLCATMRVLEFERPVQAWEALAKSILGSLNKRCTELENKS